MNTAILTKHKHTSSLENLSLSESELELCKPVPCQGGRNLRAFCPFHGSDNQRSLKINLDTGRFNCFACNAWGYIEKSRSRWRIDRNILVNRTAVVKTTEPPQKDLAEALQKYQAELPNSPAEKYLELRGISLELAKYYRIGYAPGGKWLHPTRDWKSGRVVVPHTDPDGKLLNLYGRAVGPNESVPKGMRHDHLPGGKGYFNALALRGSGHVCITESPFDALSLIAAGLESVTAIFGAEGWRWDWARKVPGLILALDADATGQKNWREIARQARLRGKVVAFLPPEAYGGLKDPNEAWMAGTLNLDA